MDRDFKGVWIPKEIRLSEDINIMCKILLVEIDSLSKTDDWCYAWNNYFAKFLWISTTQVSKYISILKDKWYIKEVSFDWRRRILKSCFEVKLKAGWLWDWEELWSKVKSRDEDKLIYNNINNNSIKEYNKNNIELLFLKEEYSFVDEFLDKDNPITAYCFKKYPNYAESQMVAVDKLIKQGYPLDVIKLALKFIKQDKFWSKNILSVKKLLEKNKDGIPYMVTIIQQMKDYRPVVMEL